MCRVRQLYNLLATQVVVISRQKQYLTGCLTNQCAVIFIEYTDELCSLFSVNHQPPDSETFKFLQGKVKYNDLSSEDREKISLKILSKLKVIFSLVLHIRNC